VAEIPSMDIELETIKLRIVAVRDAQSRARFAFLVGTIVSLAIVIATWNAGLGWDRGHALAGSWSKNPNEVTSEMTKLLMTEWVKSTVVDVAPLGIRVSSADMPILGTIALLVAAVWMYYCFRAQNHVIASLLTDTYRKDPVLRRWVLHGIHSYMVFVNFGPTASPIERFAGPSEEQEPASERFSLLFSFLIFLPALAAALSVLLDVLSLFALQPAFRFPHDPLWHFLDLRDWITVAIYEGVAIVLTTLVVFVCGRALSFEKATSRIVHRFSALGGVPNTP
jgi:hypothetical protein